MKALWIVFNFLFANFAFAQSFYTTCTPLPSSPTVADINTYNTCVANNRASAQSSGTAAAQSFTLNGSTVTAPSSGTAEQNDIYNQNVIINNATPTALTTEQLNAVSVTATGAVAALSQSMAANTEGETTYLVTSEGTLAEGLGKLSLAGECASVSSSGCYNQRSELYATGAAYLLAQRQAQDQAGQHQNARTIACNAKNQISSDSDQTICESALDNALAGLNGSVMSSVSGITVTVGPAVTSAPLSTIVYDALTGACSPPTAPACVNLSRNVAPLSIQMQQTVREILKQKYGKTGSITVTAQSLYSINKDGSISVKGDGAYSQTDFSDSKKMKAKGLSDTFVQSMTKSVASWMTATASSVTSTIISAGGLDITESPFTIAALEQQQKPTAVINPFQSEDTSREPASLKKQLGSEFIGVAKDDIFKIINRRYKSEEKEDYFY
ncbi:hypothetical protein [Pseudobdellovibrio sp. HCB154]|uniref:hypothetical protein n=1 Tax=Pseudobdellovibrio sp. HCB154 TaxID=3386277 RepID=UPI0039174A35